jgi:DNA mismatch repair protein MutS
MVRQRGIQGTVSRPGWQFSERHGLEELSRQWGVLTANGFGFADDEPAVAAVGAALSYLAETQRENARHLRPPARFEPGRHLQIDPASYRSLEIERTTRTGGHEGSLLCAVDRTKTPMGGRLLRDWLRAPLTEVKEIEQRQEAVAVLKRESGALRGVREKLSEICDVERILGRLAVSRATPRDLASLSETLSGIPALLELLRDLPEVAGGLPELAEFCGAQCGFLRSAIKPDPAPHLREGNVIARGYSRELDELRSIGRDSQQWLAQYQQQLAGQTGIPSLKIGYNRVFGYYVEVSHAHRDKPLPGAWTRRQTTKNAERLITPELKAFEDKALGAESKAIRLEQELFEQVRNALLPHVPQFQQLAARLARIDVLAGFAALSLERDYCRPAVVQGRVLEIVDGRHPVLEQSLGSEFVANSATFRETDTLALITGPNMAGKSTFIRQVALIVLLAQCGSDVPAKSATIGACDKLFTRIGASDELYAGQSTFMVEMTETANLLNNATDRSLVILDEIGRGTSTLDGLSLAWAIAEHIARKLGCRCLFATHYHELTKLAEELPGVKNLNVAVRQWEEQIIFLHRIVDGPASQSYGIQVAKLAGVPAGVVERASELLGHLKVHHGESPDRPAALIPPPQSREQWQMSLFTVQETPPELREIGRQLGELDPDELSPREAHELLRGLRAKLGAGRVDRE